MKNVILLSLGIVLFLGCIDPIKFKFSGQENHVVILSTFNTKKVLQYVRVSKSSVFGSPYNIFVLNAKVYITSKEGEKYEFKHKASGKYFTQTEVAAIAGHTYTLHVEFDGKVYESEPVKTFEETDKVSIENIHPKITQRLAIVEGEKKKKILPGYDILVDFKDPVGKKNFYRWSYHRIYEVQTQPENYMELGCLSCPRPAPKSCCRYCWITESDDMLVTANDWLRDGKSISNQMVLFIPFYQYLNKKMQLTIYQHAITEEAYNYFNALRNQAESTGSMFDAPPTELKGNIFNVADKTEKVIGYFEASVTTSKNLTIIGDEIAYKIPIFIYPDDCLTMLNSSTTRPAGW